MKAEANKVTCDEDVSVSIPLKFRVSIININLLAKKQVL